MTQKVNLSSFCKIGLTVVAVGDPNQSIYRFRGADEAAFGNIAAMLGSKKHTLSYNFRSKPSIIDFCNKNTHVNNLKAGVKLKPEEIQEWMKQPQPEDAEYVQQATQLLGGQLNPQALKAAIDGGQLPWPPSLNGKVTVEEKEYDNIFQEIAAERAAGKQVQSSFIARTNAPLANAALKLLGQGIPFTLVGKDIAGDLMKHISTLMFAKARNSNPVSEQSSIMELRSRLHDYNDEQQATHGNKASKKGYLQDLADTTSALDAAIGTFGGDALQHQQSNQHQDDNFYDIDAPAPMPSAQQQRPQGGQDVRSFKKWLQEKLGGYDLEGSEQDVLAYMKETENKDSVVLTTAHKSKGLEFERTYVLRNDLFPHPRAKRQEDLKQEANGKYVTYTRAMHELHIVKLKGQPGYDK